MTVSPTAQADHVQQHVRPGDLRLQGHPGKALPLACAHAAFMAKALPLPRAPAAFVSKTLPFLAGNPALGRPLAGR